MTYKYTVALERWDGSTLALSSEFGSYDNPSDALDLCDVISEHIRCFGLFGDKYNGVNVYVERAD